MILRISRRQIAVAILVFSGAIGISLPTLPWQEGFPRPMTAAELERTRGGQPCPGGAGTGTCWADLSTPCPPSLLCDNQGPCAIPGQDCPEQLERMSTGDVIWSVVRCPAGLIGKTPKTTNCANFRACMPCKVQPGGAIECEVDPMIIGTEPVPGEWSWGGDCPGSST